MSESTDPKPARSRKKRSTNAGKIIERYARELKILLKFRRAGHHGSCVCTPCANARKALSGHLMLAEAYIHSNLDHE